MSDFSVIPMSFKMGNQNCTSRFHNLSYCTPILMWDTSMSLWWNSLIIYIQIFLLKEGHNFNPFSCLIFQSFRMGTQTYTSRFRNLSNWTPILMWDTSMSLWWNSPIIYIQIFLLKEGLNFNPFSCLIFP